MSYPPLNHHQIDCYAELAENAPDDQAFNQIYKNELLPAILACFQEIWKTKLNDDCVQETLTNITDALHKNQYSRKIGHFLHWAAHIYKNNKTHIFNSNYIW